MDLGAIKYMTFHQLINDIYEVMALQIVHLGDDSIVKAIRIDSIFLDVMVKGITKKFRTEGIFHVPKLQI